MSVIVDSQVRLFLLTFSSHHKKDRFKLDTVKVHDLHTNFTVHALSDRSTGNYFTMFLVVLNMH